MPSPSPSPAPVHPLVAAALPFVGMREGNAAMPWATAKRAWCARFAWHVLNAAGFYVPDEEWTWSVEKLMRHLGARGYSLPHDATPFLPGDLIAKQRDGGMHVGIVTRDEGGPRLFYVSGNTYRRGRRGVVWVWENSIARSEITNAARVSV